MEPTIKMPIEQKGLKVYVGNEYTVRVAESSNSMHVTDFTKKDEFPRLLFPTSFTVKRDREVIEQARIGIPTSSKFLGKTQIVGDIGDIVTPNGIAFYAAMTLGGVTKSMPNDQAFISIEHPGDFSIDITKNADASATTEVTFMFETGIKETLAIPAGMTVNEFIDKVNAIMYTPYSSTPVPQTVVVPPIPNPPTNPPIPTTSAATGAIPTPDPTPIPTPTPTKAFLAVLHVGEGTEILNFEFPTKNEDGTEIIPAITTMSTAHSVREFFRVGAISENYKKVLAPFIHYIIPRRGDPRYFNILASSVRSPVSTQYTGCRFLSLNMAYANSALTTATTNVWAGYAYEFNGTPTQAEVDDTTGAFAQVHGQTKAYSCLQRTIAVGGLTNNFGWTVSPQWSVANEPYEIPVMTYADSYDFEMVFNEQSRAIFETRVNNSENISVLLDTKAYKEGRIYNVIKSAKTLLGQPQYPEVADGVIGLNASGFTSISNIDDPYTSLMIITSDTPLEITYTEDEMEKDFSGNDI